MQNKGSDSNVKYKEDCIFCKIVKGEIPCHKIWEDEKHLAFLSIFPNTPGFTILVTKEHYPSYAFELPDEALTNLTIAAKKVGKILDNKFDDVGRTALVYEGFGVDHVHAKLIPMHGTKQQNDWKPIESNIKTYFKKYPGYICTNDSLRADDNELKELAKKLRE